MGLTLQFFGATGVVTGSLYLVRCDAGVVLLECGLFQGAPDTEKRNREPFPVAADEVDAVVLSHAHLDHSGRVPLLVKQGYTGPVYVQEATGALCEIMWPDSGYLNEKDAEWESRLRRGRGEPPVEPLYTLEEAEHALRLLHPVPYDESLEVLPGLRLRYLDAGHILGSSIVELDYTGSGGSRRLVFSGDIGYRDAPVMNPPERVESADTVIMESTYGDRLHKPFDETMEELAAVFHSARAAQGNILIPAFTVGRTQDLLYLMAENFEEWGLGDWHIFLDSPMGIEATEVYSRYRHLYGARLFGPDSSLPDLPNFHQTRTSEESMLINDVSSGAIVIAGSGMCSGGRILHHLKNNIWRPECHLIIVGYQAIGTLGRRIVDGADTVKMWGDNYRVRIRVHTIGGLSAHGDQADLLAWYGGFEGRPPLYLVHGERDAQQALAARIREEFGAKVAVAEYQQKISV